MAGLLAAPARLLNRLLGRAPEFVLPARRPEDLARRVAALGPAPPTIGVVVPVYETPAALLRACVASVLAQAYPAWHLVLVDDGSAAPHLRPLLDRLAGQDPRIRLIRRPANGGISAALNEGLDAVSDDIVAFLDHDDHLTPDALLAVAEAFAAHPDTDAVYTDQLKSDLRGVVREHFFKPDWSPVYLLGVMYVGHLLAVRAPLARDLRFLSRFDGVQDFEFMLRLSERTGRIRHVPGALYGWRAVPGSVALGVDEKRGIDALQKLAVEEHLGRIGRSWRVESVPERRHRLAIRASDTTPRPPVSIVIPTRDEPEIVGRCLSTIRMLTRYPAFEVLVVDNGTTDPAALAAIAAHADRHIPFDRPFNFSQACNLGAAEASGEVLVFLNNDTEVVDPDWLSDMVAYLEDSGIAIVGPMLLYPDGTVQHAGVVLGARGTADHVMRRFQPHWDGYAGSLAAAREVSAVTGACLMIRRSAFEAVCGFSTDYRKHYQDVDLCLRVRERGASIVCAPQVRLVHHESVTRKAAGYDMGDRAILIDRWHEEIAAGDRFYNPKLDAQTLRYEPAAGTFASRRRGLFGARRARR